MAPKARHDTDFPYSHADLQALVAAALRGDVTKGGRCVTGGAAINVWTHPWNMKMMQESSIMGTFYLRFADRIGIARVLCEEGFSLDDLLNELALLEVQAFGVVRQGKWKT